MGMDPKQMVKGIMSVHELNKNLVKGSEWLKDSRVDIAILFTNKTVSGKHEDGNKLCVF